MFKIRTEVLDFFTNYFKCFIVFYFIVFFYLDRKLQQRKNDLQQKKMSFLNMPIQKCNRQNFFQISFLNHCTDSTTEIISFSCWQATLLYYINMTRRWPEPKTEPVKPLRWLLQNSIAISTKLYLHLSFINSCEVFVADTTYSTGSVVNPVIKLLLQLIT